MTTLKRVIKKSLPYLFAGVLIIGVTSLVLAAIFLYSASSSFLGSNTIQNPSQYSELLDSYDDWKGIAHFPEQIPRQARGTRLFFSQPDPKFGGLYAFELRMQLPKEEIAMLQAKYRAMAERIYEPGGKNNSPREEVRSDGITIVYDYFLYTEHEAMNHSPDDFAFYVLGDARGASEYTEGYSINYGVAINESTSVVVYWMNQG